MDEIDDLVASVAAAIVRQHGKSALDYLKQRAQMAKATGDMESAVDWWDIALAVVDLEARQLRKADRVRFRYPDPLI